MPKRNVMINIHTVRTGLSATVFDVAMDDGEETDAYGEEDVCDEPIDESDGEEGTCNSDEGGNIVPPQVDPYEPEESDLMMEGRLITGIDRVGLLYEESELTGMEGSTTTVSFFRNKPGLISMLRSGAVNTALVFEEGKRHVCVYHTPFSDFEVCVQTITVENELLTEGRLHLVYAVEIHGARAEKCDMTVTIR